MDIRQLPRLLGCLVLACLVLAWQGPKWLDELCPNTYALSYGIPDFFQEWASARNYYTGLPIYTRHEVTLPLYLGEYIDPNNESLTVVNAHPPASVLLALPFALMDYDEAFVLWNGVSLILFGSSIWLVLHTLGIKTPPWVIFLLFTFLLFCFPLLSQVRQGQLSAPLAFLLTLSWRLERTNRPGLAGVFLGLATALKLFPGLLFLPFILRRRWRVVFFGIGCMVVLIGLTVAVFGFATYQTYICDVLPLIQRYRGAAHNLSLCGIWYKLLVPLPHCLPVTFVPASPHSQAAFGGYLICSVLIVLFLSRLVLRNSHDPDLTFSSALVALLLVAPVTWDHYLLLLVLPVVVLWQRLWQSSPAWLVFLCCVALLWVRPFLVMKHCLILVGAGYDPQTGRWLATPLETLTALSVPCYGLIGLFALLYFSKRLQSIPPGNCNCNH